MLLSLQSNRYAQQLLAARADARQMPPLSAGDALSLADAYEIAKNIQDIRIAQGEIPAGRKIGLVNRTVWSRYGLCGSEDRDDEGDKGDNGAAGEELIWAPLFDSTIRYADDNHGFQSLQGAVQPRIQPEIIFKLASAPPAGAGIETIAECIEWLAHGLEIVVCPFPDWKFNRGDALAAFGLHGTLIVGEQKTLSAASRRNLARVLSMASVSVSRASADNVVLCGAGFGSDLAGSPVHALLKLHQLLQTQPQFSPLSAGEIIATGSLTDSYPIAAGQSWTTAFSGVDLSGLTVSFV